PVWSTHIGSTTTDALIQWLCIGPPITPVFSFALVYFNSGLSLQIGPPTGLRAYNSQNSCQIEWVTPGFNGFTGVRVQLSSDPNGINPPFTQYGSTLISGVERTENTVVSSTTNTQVNGNVTTATTTSVTQTNEFSSVVVP